MLKWYENLAFQLIFTALIDIPALMPTNDQDRIDYIMSSVRRLYWPPGRNKRQKWDEERFKEVMAISQRSSGSLAEPLII